MRSPHADHGGDLGAPVRILIRRQRDHAANPPLPHPSGCEFERAGPGALLGVGAPAVDLACFILGNVSEVIGAGAMSSIPERFLPKLNPILATLRGGMSITSSSTRS